MRLEAGDSETLALILEVVRQRAGLDFSQYRRTTLQRRVLNRVIAANDRDCAGYLRRLQQDPAEAERLVATLTIKVSRFFRNPDTFALLSVLLHERAAAHRRPLSVWSAGCAHGEEAWSLAMLGGEVERVGGVPTAVLATDIDTAALARAHQGRYRPSAMGDVPEPMRRHLRPARDAVVVAEPLRRRVAFACHDLTSGRPPLPAARFDLVCCRNTLIYFDAPLQLRALQVLLSCLAEDGLLCLGEAEWPARELADDLEVVDRRARVFRRRVPGEPR